MKTKFDLVIVGGGLTAARAIKEYRAEGRGRIALLTKEQTLPYHRPPLSKRYLRGEAERSDTLVEAPDFYEDVELLLGSEVTRMIPTSRRSRPPTGVVTGTGSS